MSVCGVAWAELTTAEFERRTEAIRAGVDETVEQEFADALAAHEQLKEPFEKGRQVTVRVRRGAGYDSVTGRFGGLVRGGGYASISGRPILLEDLAAADADRMRFYNDADRHRAMLEVRWEELEKALSHRRKQLLRKRYSEAGFTPDFFRGMVRLGDRVVPLKTLGHERVLASVALVEGSAAARFSLYNGTKLPYDFVLTLDGSGVATTLDADGAPTGSWHGTNTNTVKRDDLGPNPVRDLERSCRLICSAREYGSWLLEPAGRPQIRTSSIIRSGKRVRALRIRLTFQVVPAPGPKPGPFELRSAMAVSDEERQQRFSEVGAYMAALASIAESEPEPEPQVTPPPAEPVDVAEPDEPAAGGGGSSLDEVRAALKAYTWRPAAAVGVETSAPSWRFLAVPEMDHPEAPSTVAADTVRYLTDWQRIPARRERGPSLVFPEYRLLIAEGKEGVRCYFQYRGTFSNLESVATRYRFGCAFSAGGAARSLEHHFRVAPNWSGKIHLAAVFTEHDLRGGIDDVKIQVSVAGAE